MSGRVIVVGSVNVDLVIGVDHLPASGETVTGGRFSRHHGGKGGNQATAAVRLGVPTAFIGAVGDDPFGAEARGALEAAGVDLRGMVTLEGEATGVALITVDSGGENTIAVAGGANTSLAPEHVEQAFAELRPGAGDVVLVGHEIRTPTTMAALRLARDAGATAVLNPAPVGDLSVDVIALAHVVTPNRLELMDLVDEDLPDAGPAARSLLTGAPDLAVLVSLGADGALLVRSTGSLPIPALAGISVVDTVGAGDTLNGALAAGLATGLQLEEAARRAVAAASLAVTRAGARDGMPTAGELDAALQPTGGRSGTATR